MKLSEIKQWLSNIRTASMISVLVALPVEAMPNGFSIPVNVRLQDGTNEPARYNEDYQYWADSRGNPIKTGAVTHWSVIK